MLQKCANPGCSSEFRYLHEGTLFEVETQYLESSSVEGRAKPNGKGYVERCWLCDQCAAHITLRFDRRQGLVMISSLGDCEQTLTLTFQQASPKPTTEIARVLIRPLELEVTASTRRRAGGNSTHGGKIR